MKGLKTYAFLGALSAALAAGGAMAQATKMAIGYSPAADFVPLLIAKDKGFFEKRNLDVTPVKIPLASNIPSAIVSGSLQIGMGTAPMLLQTSDAGLDLVAVEGAARFVSSNSVVSLVARTGVKVAKAEDLKGKKVGVPGFNSVLHVLLQKWLLNNKVPLNQVSMIEAPFPQMKDLLKGGTLDAVAVIEPFRARILEDKTGYRVADYHTDVRDDILAAFWMAKRDWASANAVALKAFREAYSEGIAYARQYPDEARAIAVKYLGVASPVVPNYSTEVTVADLEFYAGIGRELGMFRKPVEPAKLIVK